MKSVCVCLLIIICSIAVSAEFYEVDVAGPIMEPEEALQALRELGYEVTTVEQEKRVTNWPPIYETAACAGVSQSSCVSLFKDSTRNTWFVRNCCSSNKQPIMKFKSVANVNLYEDCIGAGLS
jgi:hypothetical protein